MKATVLYTAGKLVSVRLFNPADGKWYDGATWSITEANADLLALTEKAFADPDLSRFSKDITTWPLGDYLVEYVNIATDEVIAEESFITLASIMTVAELLEDVAVNKKVFTNETGVTYLNIYNDAGDTIILKFPYKDSSGADILLSAIGEMAQQLASTV